MALFCRVVARSGKITDVSGLKFLNFGAHCDNYPCNYLTAAAAIGMTKTDVDLFINRLDQVLKKSKKSNIPKQLEVTKHTLDSKTCAIDDSSAIPDISKDKDVITKGDSNTDTGVTDIDNVQSEGLDRTIKDVEGNRSNSEADDSEIVNDEDFVV